MGRPVACGRSGTARKTDGASGASMPLRRRREEADECVAIIAETSPELNARVEEVVERDWVTMSLEGLPPVSAGPFFVAGSHAIARHAPGKIAVLIEAGPAFGTGHHGHDARLPARAG